MSIVADKQVLNSIVYEAACYVEDNYALPMMAMRNSPWSMRLTPLAYPHFPQLLRALERPERTQARSCSDVPIGEGIE